LSRADDVEGVRIAVDGISDYRSMFEQTGLSQGGGPGLGNMSGGMGTEGKSLEDLFYQKEMEISKLAFTRQFTHAIVYAWVKLREQVSFCILLFLISPRMLNRVRKSGISRGSRSALRKTRRRELATTLVFFKFAICILWSRPAFRSNYVEKPQAFIEVV
jgi:hypothetical protein